MAGPAVGMPCPVCNVPLAMSERQGVEIDYCPQCRGVWLDRGELDKIISRAIESEAPAPAPAPPPPAQPSFTPPPPGWGQQAPYGSHDPYRGSKGYPKRKKSFLEELFD